MCLLSGLQSFDHIGLHFYFAPAVNGHFPCEQSDPDGRNAFYNLIPN